MSSRWNAALGDSASGSVPGLVSLPHVRDMGINGPYNPDGGFEHSQPPQDFHLPSVRRSEELPCAKRFSRLWPARLIASR